MEIAPMIITRILRDKNVTLSQLEAKAVERSISLQDLYTALDKVHKDKRIKRGVRQGDVYYEPAPAPKAPTTYARPDYPRETIPESPFKVCSCPLTHVHWKPEMGHFKDCDSMVYPEEYVQQNPWDATAGLLINHEEYERVVVQSQYKYGKKKSYG